MWILIKYIIIIFKVNIHEIFFCGFVDDICVIKVDQESGLVQYNYLLW